MLKTNEYKNIFFFLMLQFFFTFAPNQKYTPENEKITITFYYCNNIP
jgi:hypothetical protein